MLRTDTYKEMKFTSRKQGYVHILNIYQQLLITKNVQIYANTDMEHLVNLLNDIITIFFQNSVSYYARNHNQSRRRCH